MTFEFCDDDGAAEKEVIGHDRLTTTRETHDTPSLHRR